MLLGSTCWSQAVTETKFIFGRDTIHFTKIDYATKSTSKIFITMYEDNVKTDGLISNAKAFLQDQQNLCHRSYYFIPLTQAYDQQHKEELFASITKYIYDADNLGNGLLYLNFDKDYATTYVKSLIKNQALPPLTRIKTKVKAKNIKNVLLR